MKNKLKEHDLQHIANLMKMTKTQRKQYYQEQIRRVHSSPYGRYLRRLDEAFDPKKLSQLLRVIAKILQKYTGEKIDYVGTEKIRKAKGGNTYVIYYGIGKSATLRFLFTSAFGEKIDTIEVHGKGKPIAIQVGDVPIKPKLKEVADIIKNGAGAAKTLTVKPPEEEEAILTPEEKALEAEFKKYLILDNDIKGKIRLLKISLYDLGQTMYGLLVTGTPGVGKTFTTMKVLEEQGKIEGSDYVVATGGKMTDAQMYIFLYENFDKTIIFDDMDSMWDSQTAVNMLKGALQTQGPRTINWRTKTPLGDDDMGNPIENVIDFEGNMVFITNLMGKDLTKAEPVLDRVFKIHFDVDPDKLIAYVDEMLEHILPDAPMDVKKTAFDFFKKFGKKYSSYREKKVISIRAYTKTVAQVLSGKAETDWKTAVINMA